jgi:hypothetical protein
LPSVYLPVLRHAAKAQDLRFICCYKNSVARPAEVSPRHMVLQRPGKKPRARVREVA